MAFAKKTSFRIMEETNHIITTINLSIGYSNKNSHTIIAQNLNLNFEKGKLITLIGANGVGKSTLLRTLIGIQKPLSGTVILNQNKIQNFCFKSGKMC